LVHKAHAFSAITKNSGASGLPWRFALLYHMLWCSRCSAVQVMLPIDTVARLHT